MKKLTIHLILLILIIPLAAAECLTYKDSPFYCQELSLQEAESECNLYTNCNPTFIEANCQIRECELIICKSNCQTTFVGNCASGAVPLGEDWCLAGYCHAKICTETANRWLCEIDGGEFNNEPCSTQPVVPELSIEQPGNSIIPWVLLAIFLVSIIYYIFRRKWKQLSLFNIPGTSRSWFSPFNSSPRIQAHLRELKKDKSQKIKKHHRATYLAEHGLQLEERDEFQNLHSITNQHQRAKNRQEIRRKEAPFRKLAQLEPREMQSSPDIFTKLRNLIEKK